MDSFNQAVVPFTVSATNLNLLDSTPITLFTTATDGMIRVPTRLMLTKAAGTAYTITPFGGFEGDFVEGGTLDSYSDALAPGANLVVTEVEREVTGAGKQVRRLFSVPLVGFLDQTSAQSRLVLPHVAPRVWSSGVVEWDVRLTAGVAGGTGALTGLVYFDQFPLL
jgi:hypothetical protein